MKPECAAFASDTKSMTEKEPYVWGVEGQKRQEDFDKTPLKTITVRFW